MQIWFLSIFPSVAACHHHLSNAQTDTPSKGPSFELRWLILVLSCGEFIACASYSTLYAWDTENKHGRARLFLCKVYYFCIRLLLACFKLNLHLFDSIYTLKSCFNYIFSIRQFLHSMCKFQREYLHVHCNQSWQGKEEQWLSNYPSSLFTVIAERRKITRVQSEQIVIRVSC